MRPERHYSDWWGDNNLGIKNWIAVLLVAAMAITSAVLIVMLLQRPTQVVSAGTYTAKPVPTSTTPEKTVALFIGDSYSGGAGASNSSNKWTTVVSRELSWSEANEALGGTGYVATAGKDGCGLDYCGTYSEAIASAEVAKPAIVVVSGGRNDNTRLTRDAVESTIRAATSRWPEAQVVVTTPLWDDDEEPSWFADSVELVRSAAADTGVTLLDLGQPLADHPDFVVADGVHPNDVGHRAIAEAFVTAWRSAFP